MNNKHVALVALGTNAPFEKVSGAALLVAALHALDAAGLRPLRVSGAWRTAPWPPSDQPDYVNAVALIDPRALTPPLLFEALATIEEGFGRVRSERWGPRTLDLDIIDQDGLAGDFSGIILPHPRAANRAFVLAPLAEAAPDWRHPVLDKTAAQLLAGLGAQAVSWLGPLPGWCIAESGERD